MTKIIPQFYAEVRNGGLIYEKPERRDFYLKNLKDGLKVCEILKPARKPRTTSENSYYWGVIVEMVAEETGMTADEAHNAMKILFLKKRINEKLFTIRSSATLNTLEFEEYVENCRRWASMELGLYIPLPNEVNL